jgi:pantoate--beta-alanine ligase
LKRVARDLFLPVEVLGCPTVRERDGLALSSRNAYLSPEGRGRALSLSQGLRAAMQAFAQGERRVAALEALARGPLQAAADRIDYVCLADPDTLAALAQEGEVGERALIAMAARIEGTRLIDNVVLGEDAW